MVLERTALAAALIAAIWLSACTGSSQIAEPAVDDIPTYTEPDQVEWSRLPYGEYVAPDPRRDSVLRRANAQRVGGCMLAQGFEYAPLVSGSLDLIDELQLSYGQPRRYGLFDADEANANGYEIDVAAENALLAKANELDAEVADSQPGYAEALGNTDPAQASADGAVGHDDPNAGCLAKAGPSSTQRQIAGLSWADADSLVQEASATAYDRASQDSRVAAAVRAWSECMHDAGFDFDQVFDPPDWFSKQRNAVGGVDVSAILRGDLRQDGHVDLADLKTLERETAATDVGCKVSSNLIGIWFAVELAYAEREMAEHPEVFEAYLEARDQRYRDALAAVGDA